MEHQEKKNCMEYTVEDSRRTVDEVLESTRRGYRNGKVTFSAAYNSKGKCVSNYYLGGICHAGILKSLSYFIHDHIPVSRETFDECKDFYEALIENPVIRAVYHEVDNTEELFRDGLFTKCRHVRAIYLFAVSLLRIPNEFPGTVWSYDIYRGLGYNKQQALTLCNLYTVEKAKDGYYRLRAQVLDGHKPLARPSDTSLNYAREMFRGELPETMRKLNLQHPGKIHDFVYGSCHGLTRGSGHVIVGSRFEKLLQRKENNEVVKGTNHNLFNVKPAVLRNDAYDLVKNTYALSAEALKEIIKELMEG